MNARFAVLLATIIAASSQYAYSAPVIIGNYYEENASLNGCVNGCILRFSSVPTGQRLTITHVACDAIGGLMFYARLGMASGPSTIRNEPIPLFNVPTPTFPTPYHAVTTTRRIFTAGQRPAVAFGTNDRPGDFDCQISGVLN